MKRIHILGLCMTAIALILAGCPVDSQYTRVSGFSVTEASISLGAGSSHTLTWTITPADAGDTGVVWTSSNSAVASVDNGVVTGVSNGSAVITGTTTDGGYSASVAVTVAGIGASPYAVNLYLIGSTATVTASAGKAAYTWTSTDPGIVTVAASGTNNETGTLTAQALGSTTITVSDGISVSATVTVRVGPIVRYTFETLSAGVFSNTVSSSFALGVTSGVAQVTGISGTYAANFPTADAGYGTITTSGGLLSSSATGITFSAYVKTAKDWSNFVYFVSGTKTLAMDSPNMFSSDVAHIYPGIAAYNSAGCSNSLTWDALSAASAYKLMTVVVNFTAGTTTYYLDGVEWVPYTGMSSIVSVILDACVSGTVYVGRVYTDPTTNLDDFRIYNTALSATQVSSLYTECEAAK